MTSLLVASETSLYDLVANSAEAPAALQVSPVTFKALMSSVLDLLVEQQIPAVVWAKLPRGDAWQAEFDRYGDLEGLPQNIFLFKNQREDTAEKADPCAPELLDSSKVRSLQVGPESPLRREYFLLIWSEQFCALLIAHRTKGPQKPDDSHAAFTSDDESAEKRPSLMTFLVLDQTIIQRSIDQLQSTDPDHNWQDIISAIAPQPLNPALAEQLLNRQIQRQEDLWQRGSNYRRQADSANILQLQNEELISTIRLKDEFLHTVGQELRTPLTTMKTALTLLNSPSLKPPQRQRYMDMLVKECDRQSSLISSLLDLVSLDQMAEAATVQSIRLMDVVPGVVSTYQPLAEEKGVRLAYTIPENLPLIACHSPWLKQIVIHLLHNGIKFTPNGGQVWVRAKQLGEYIQLEFKDTGIGIAQHEVNKIFDRFYRVRQTSQDAEESGAGLGLSIVEQLLRYCGGSITVKSRVGEGSLFHVMLPIAEEKP